MLDGNIFEFFWVYEDGRRDFVLYVDGFIMFCYDIDYFKLFYFNWDFVFFFWSDIKSFLVFCVNGDIWRVFVKGKWYRYCLEGMYNCKCFKVCEVDGV